MAYPYKYPLSRFFARCGATISFRIDVTHDAEENVYIATSEDIPGLVIEAESFSQLRDEVSEAIPTLLSFGRDSDHDHTSADVLYKDHIAIA